MHRRDFVKAALLTGGGAFALQARGRAMAARQPNFVFFLVDDLGWRDLGCYGSVFYETPNVDGLAGSGMKFTNAYAACPVCSPTRASIMTGKYPVRTKVTDYIAPEGHNQPSQWSRNTKLLPPAYSDRLDLKEFTIAEAFKEAGYRTFFAGKWHLGPEGFWPEDQGFDINKGGIEQGGPYGGNKYFSPYGNPRLEDGLPGEHLPDRLAIETSRFIETNKDRPFFAWLSFYSVHTPLMAREDLRLKYEAKAKRLDIAGPRFLPERASEARQVQDDPVYGGMVEAMDLAVGKVLQTLDRLRLTDNTVVVFMSDNGGLSTSHGSPTSNVPLRAGKGWMYEGGIREPMIVRAPGVTTVGSVCHSPVTSTDFYPTFLELAGLPGRPKQHMDGVSLVPLLRGKPMDRGPLFWHYPHYANQGGAPASAIRDGDWKLIEWLEDGRLELFHLASDISEKYNLVKQYPQHAKRLHHLLTTWRHDTAATMPIVNPRYKVESTRARAGRPKTSTEENAAWGATRTMGTF